MMDWAGIATVLGAATVLVGAIASAAVMVIKALHENTRVTVENTADRAIKATTSNVQLAAIASTVGAPVTVPTPERQAVAVVASAGTGQAGPNPMLEPPTP